MASQSPVKHSLAPKGRTFSKRLVVANCALVWALLAYATATGQLASVASYAFGFLAAIGGAYMGVGHMDLRTFLSTLSATSGALAPISDVVDPSKESEADVGNNL
jgi:hypothetical protein